MRTVTNTIGDGREAALRWYETLFKQYAGHATPPQPTCADMLRNARRLAQTEIADPRERAIVVRCIEDAICRIVAVSAGALS